MPLNYRFLALLWLPVSLTAVFLVAHDRAWLRPAGVLERLAAVRLEQWVALALLATQGWLVLRAHAQRPR